MGFGCREGEGEGMGMEGEGIGKGWEEAFYLLVLFCCLFEFNPGTGSADYGHDCAKQSFYA